ncbi:hypothetical protein Micbo1qcDRAFT_156787 [Microdochium bolleyi]|uniref:Uncharacterized protein n=1 Tax=Microdochium bolleyi TaxID=196109 RepID=A0A136JCY0_9PEZI|nr:hypothetical protein Micbo1qcDRAFT_156787 [Microdochium bolleyi]
MQDDSKTTTDKAVADAKEFPCLWFVNFATPEASGQPDALAKYIQDVQDYRCWASLVWWKTAYAQQKLPQDGSRSAIAMRNSYCAKVATKHMQQTPWLAMVANNNVSKEISCSTPDLHRKLIDAVLEGFVTPSTAAYEALEPILGSLRQTIEARQPSSDSRTIVCQRFEYIKEADVIKSYTRVISLWITDSIRKLCDAKKTEKEVSCEIEFNDYETMFNQKLWKQTAESISGEQKTAMAQYVANQTVVCPP